MGLIRTFERTWCIITIYQPKSKYHRDNIEVLFDKLGPNLPQALGEFGIQ